MKKLNFTQKIQTINSDIESLFFDADDIESDYKLSQFQLIKNSVDDYIKELEKDMKMAEYISNKN